LYSGQFNHVGYFLRWIHIRSVSRWLSNSGHNNQWMRGRPEQKRRGSG
jgi:hypothetical protein